MGHFLFFDSGSDPQQTEYFDRNHLIFSRRSVAGIRGRTLIITLPGSKKASQENIPAVINPVAHGLDMLCSKGSADCAK